MSGTERGFACLGHDTISLNLLRSWIKRNQPTGRKNWKRGMRPRKNKKEEQRGKRTKGGFRDWRVNETVDNSKYACGPLESTLSFSL